MSKPDYTPAQVCTMLEECLASKPMDIETGTQSTGSNTMPPPAVATVAVGTDPDPRSRVNSASTSASSSLGNGTLPRAYANVRAARNSALTVRPLYGSEVILKNDLGTFCNENDNRTQLANYRHIYDKKLTSAVLSIYKL
jgi:hypothetical protein